MAQRLRALFFEQRINSTGSEGSMHDTPTRPKPTTAELQGRAEWLHFVLEAARREGRVISAAEHSVFERYIAGEIDGDEARRRLLRLFETAERIAELDQ
jgi:hypothetical protein